MAMSSVSTLWRSYLRLMEKYPWRTTAFNTSVLLGTGDFIAQVAVEGKTFRTYETKRTLRFLGTGLFIFGPTMHLWYSNLDKVIKGTRHHAALKKVFMDQAFFLPSYLGSFLWIMGFLRRERFREVQHKFVRDFKPLLLVSYELWPVVMIMNFYLIPNHHRVLVVNIVGILWNTYLAWKSEEK